MIDTEESSAIILVGGKGSRLKQGESEEFKLWPKALVRTGNKRGLTMLDLVRERLKTAGVNNIIFLTGKDPEAEEELIQMHVRAFYGKESKFSSEDAPLGTAGAIDLALKRNDVESVIVAPVDTDFPYEKLLEIPADHPGRKSIIWMVTSHKGDGQQNIGKILCDPETGQIKYVLEGENPPVVPERERAGLAGLTSGGVLLVNREFYLETFPKYQQAHPDKNGKPISVYGDFIRWLVETGASVYAYDVKGPVMDLGRPEALDKYKTQNS